jgi:olfactory receptor
MMTMILPNNSHLFPHVFFLAGIPGLTTAHIWISLPFCFMFFLALTGNGVLLFLIWTEHRFHQSMFLFLAMLSFVDLVLSLSMLPKMLAIFWFDAMAITLQACLSQMFIIHAFSAMESRVLVAMALDRFVVICNPLHYATTLTPGVVIKIGGLVVLRGVGLTIFFPSLAHQLPYCDSHIIACTYCEHMTVAKLACGITTMDSLYAFAVAVFLGVGDVAYIAYSYGQIVKTVIHFPSPEARAKVRPISVSSFSSMDQAFFLWSCSALGHAWPLLSRSSSLPIFTCSFPLLWIPSSMGSRPSRSESVYA